MKRISLMALVFGCVCAAPIAVHAKVRIDVDLTRQHMTVISGSGERYDWPISSGRPGHATPRGTYRPTKLESWHYSNKYDAPMPNSIFFTGGYAIHSSWAFGSLGTPASHGCIRLSPFNAETLYDMVKAEGGATISIHGSPRNAAAYEGGDIFDGWGSDGESRQRTANRRRPERGFFDE